MQVRTTANFLALSSGKVFDIRGASDKEGVDVIAFDKHGGENQMFFVDQEIGWIINVFSRKAITYDHRSKKLVQQSYCSGTNQQWLFEPYQSGYIIRSSENGEDVITYDPSARSLVLKPFTSEDNQLWIIV